MADREKQFAQAHHVVHNQGPNQSEMSMQPNSTLVLKVPAATIQSMLLAFGNRKNELLGFLMAGMANDHLQIDAFPQETPDTQCEQERRITLGPNGAVADTLVIQLHKDMRIVIQADYSQENQTDSQ